MFVYLFYQSPGISPSSLWDLAPLVAPKGFVHCARLLALRTRAERRPMRGHRMSAGRSKKHADYEVSGPCKDWPAVLAVRGVAPSAFP
eukprot:15470821-Alexandrium_andersonii.AAC.1